jgi:hypothetical protein
MRFLKLLLFGILCNKKGAELSAPRLLLVVFQGLGEGIVEFHFCTKLVNATSQVIDRHQIPAGLLVLPVHRTVDSAHRLGDFFEADPIGIHGDFSENRLIAKPLQLPHHSFRGCFVAIQNCAFL